jgi:hypothetical protein
MRVATWLVLAGAGVALAAGEADAGKLAGVSMPETVTVAGKRLTLNGMGLREATVFDVDVYVAGLYVEQPSSEPAALLAPDQPKMLVLKFVRDVDRDDMVDAWNKGFQKNATTSLDTLRPMIQQLNGWMPGELEDGDSLAFTYVPGEGVTVSHNGVRKGIIANAEFARSLFSVWLGPKPPGKALKRGLLGGG